MTSELFGVLLSIANKLHRRGEDDVGQQLDAVIGQLFINARALENAYTSDVENRVRNSEDAR